MDLTHEVSAESRSITLAVSPTCDLLAEAKKNLGVRTTVEVAAACGLSKSTVERLAANPSSTILGNAVRFATATGIPLDTITGTGQLPALSEAA